MVHNESMNKDSSNISFGKRLVLTALVALGAALFSQVADSEDTQVSATTAQVSVAAEAVHR